MSEQSLAIVTTAKVGEDAYSVYVFPADECTIRFSGPVGVVFWSRQGDPSTAIRIRETGVEAEHWVRAVFDVEYQPVALPWDKAVEKAKALREELFNRGRLVAE